MFRRTHSDDRPGFVAVRATWIPDTPDETGAGDVARLTRAIFWKGLRKEDSRSNETGWVKS